MKMICKIKGQVWIETVLYTLIGLALIGLVLGIVTPKINAMRDRILVEQTIDSLNALDGRINEVLDRGPGNVRKISSFTMKQGNLYFNSSDDEIIFVLENLKKPYSEPGAAIKVGKIVIISEEGKKESKVSLVLSYKGVANITCNGEDSFKKFTAVSTPYSFSIENLGDKNDNGLFVVNIEENSGG